MAPSTFGTLAAAAELATKADVERLATRIDAVAARLEATLYRTLGIQGAGVVIITGAIIAIAAALKPV